MLKGVIFDMDGLMIDTEKLLTRFWCEAANHYGYPMTKEHVLGIRSLAAKYAIPHLKGIFGEDFDYYKVRAKRIELMNEFIRQNGIEKKKGLDFNWYPACGNWTGSAYLVCEHPYIFTRNKGGSAGTDSGILWTFVYNRKCRDVEQLRFLYTASRAYRLSESEHTCR